VPVLQKKKLFLNIWMTIIENMPPKLSQAAVIKHTVLAMGAVKHVNIHNK
jgi:hypothetical protein